MASRPRGFVPAALLLTTLLVGLTALPASSTHTAGTVGAPLRPNLQTRGWVPNDAVITVSQTATQVLLRLDNEVMNAHTGALEIFPRKSDCDSDGDAQNDRMAHQRIFLDKDGNGYFERRIDRQSDTHVAGCMQYHPAHSHWHFDAFALYELYPCDPLTGLCARSTPAAQGTKATFCVIDIHRTFPMLSGSPSSGHYKSCSRTSTQGLSVGWADEYTYTLAGQHIDVTGVPPGNYCLVSTADPDDVLLETDETDNSASIGVTLSDGDADGRIDAVTKGTAGC